MTEVSVNEESGDGRNQVDQDDIENVQERATGNGQRQVHQDDGVMVQDKDNELMTDDPLRIYNPDILNKDLVAVRGGGSNTSMSTKKKGKIRTEPLSPYAVFLKEEKKKSGSKPLNMIVVNQIWRNMSPFEREPFVNLSKADKESLGSFYRQGRSWNKSKIKPVIEGGRKQMKKKNQQMRKEPKKSRAFKIRDFAKVQEETNLSNLLEELQALDAKINEKAMMKAEQLKEIIELECKTEAGIKETDELDSSVNYYKMKCNVLRRELNE